MGYRLRSIPPAVGKEALGRIGRTWRVSTTVAVTVYGLSVVSMCAGFRLDPMRVMPGAVCLFLGNFALLFIAANVLFWQFRARVRSHAKTVLREREYRFCPDCLYDLAGLQPVGLCPECGRAFSPDMLAAAWLKQVEKI